MAPDPAATGLGWLGPHFPGPHLLSLAGPSARPSAPLPSSGQLSTSSYRRKSGGHLMVLLTIGGPSFPTNPLSGHPYSLLLPTSLRSSLHNSRTQCENISRFQLWAPQIPPKRCWLIFSQVSTTPPSQSHTCQTATQPTSIINSPSQSQIPSAEYQGQRRVEVARDVLGLRLQFCGPGIKVGQGGRIILTAAGCPITVR